MEYLTEEDETKYKEHFAAYIENEIPFDEVEDMYKVRTAVESLYCPPRYTACPACPSCPMYAFAGYAKVARVGGRAGAPHAQSGSFTPNQI